MKRKQFIRMLRRYRRGAHSEKDEAAVEQWFRNIGNSKVDELSGSDKEAMRKAMWERLRSHVVKERRRPVSTMWVERRSIRLVGLAASVAVLVLSFVFFLGPLRMEQSALNLARIGEKDILNNTDKVLYVELSDGSRISLQPSSRVVYNEPFGDGARTVTLEGAAFFEIERDVLHPFLVNTEDVVTKVLGTSFTVSAFSEQGDVVVSVKTGKVSVKAKKPDIVGNAIEETVVSSNQKAIYNRGTHAITRRLVEDPQPVVSHAALTREHFERASVAEIFRALEKYYGVEIKFDENVFKNCLLTTSISGGSIRNRLDIICKAVNATYNFQDVSIVISGGGCH